MALAGGCNWVQGATASLAFTAILALWNLQLTKSKGSWWVRIPPSPNPTPPASRLRSPTYLNARLRQNLTTGATVPGEDSQVVELVVDPVSVWPPSRAIRPSPGSLQEIVDPRTDQEERRRFDEIAGYSGLRLAAPEPRQVCESEIA